MHKRASISKNRVTIGFASPDDEKEYIVHGNLRRSIVEIMNAINRIEAHLGLKETDFSELIRSRRNNDIEKKARRTNQSDQKRER